MPQEMPSLAWISLPGWVPAGDMALNEKVFSTFPLDGDSLITSPRPLLPLYSGIQKLPSLANSNC